MRKQLLLFLLASCLLCNSLEERVPCDSDAQCSESLSPKYYCSEGTCAHESIIPRSLYEMLGIVLIVIISMVANLGGIGGGEVIVSVYIYFFEYSIREAVPLSKVTIFAGALINFLVNYNRRHSLNKNAFLIDYKLISLIIPMMLAGTTVGVVFTNSFPSAIILIFIVFLVLNYTIRMVVKARKLQALENIAGFNGHNKPERSFTEDVQKLFKWAANLAKIPPQVSRPKASHAYEQLPQKDLFDEVKDEEIRVNERKKQKSFRELIKKDTISIAIVFLALFTVLATTFLRTAHLGVSGGSKCSSFAFLLFAAAQVICLFLVQLSYRNNMQILTNLTIGSIEGNKRFFRWIIWNSYLAGVLAGTLGMGGGIIINPMLIELGIAPEISTAASSVVVLFTSMSTSSQFFMLGGISLSNLLLVLIMSGFGAYLAAVYLDEIIRAYKRPSILVWILAGLLVVSCITIPVVGRIRIAHEKHPFSFSSPC